MCMCTFRKVMITRIFVSLDLISLAQDFPLLLIIYLRNYRKRELKAVLLCLCGAVRQDCFKALCPFSALNLINVVVPIHRSCCAVERVFELQSVDISL